jgi:uncharacterized protein YggT (Ycf19 family)
MDDPERTVRRIRTEDLVEDPSTTTVLPVQPVAPANEVYVAVDPAVPVAPAVPAAAAAPVRPSVAATPMATSRDGVVTEREIVIDRPTTLELARRVITLAFGVLQGLIVLRIILLLLVANRQNDVVQFVLNVTSPFVAPFRDMFALDQISRSGAVLDVAAIVALIGWTLVELLVLAILNLGARRSRTEVY